MKGRNKKMIILTKGIYEISRKGNKLILAYGREEDALRAIDKIYEENEEWYNKAFPHGVFNDGELKEYRTSRPWMRL